MFNELTLEEKKDIIKYTLVLCDRLGLLKDDVDLENLEILIHNEKNLNSNIDKYDFINHLKTVITNRALTM